MKLPDVDTARDEIVGLLERQLRDKAGTLVNAPLHVEYVGVKPEQARPSDAPWLNVELKHTSTGRQTLAPIGRRRITRHGLITVQVFAPLLRGGITLAEKLAIIARDAFEGRGTASGIFFRRTQIREIGADAMWFQINVSSEFQYDSAK